MPYVNNGDVMIHYLDEGEGEPVVLLHGHTQDRRIWNSVVGPLVAAGLRVIRPDLRGHGKSTRPDSGYHPSHHAGDLEALLDASSLTSATLVGYSIGGAIALETALTRPDRLVSLVLVAPVMPNRPYEPAFMECLKEVARVVRSEGVEAAMAGPWAECPLFEHSFSKPGVLEQAQRITRDFPGAEYLATERDRVDRDWAVPDRLNEIAVPTAVIIGAQDMAGFQEWAEEAAHGIRNATLDRLHDCGHLLPLEAPDRLAEAIVEVTDRTRPIRP
ncbi:MAG: alpha/beta hydrolase [Holophagae bacterium]|jgi:3-oxoadipate enol-lactonase